MYKFKKPSTNIYSFCIALFLMILSNHCISATQEQKLIASDGAMVDWFGGDVSISGNYAVVGANQVEVNGKRIGAAYVYEYDGNSWVEKIKLLPPQEFENFGASVSISGNRIIVGAPNAIIDGLNFTGTAYVYERDASGSWNFTQKLIASDHAISDRFGGSVSIDGDQLIVAAKQNDEVVNGSGAVYVFDYINNNWDESQILLASDPLLNDHFGTNIQIENNRIVIGAPDADDSVVGVNTGKAYVFEKTGATWTETQILTAGTDMAEGDQFANDISLSGDRIVVGAPSNADAGTRSGSAYVFHYDQAMASWDSGLKLTAFDAAAYDRFGAAVSISGDKMLIGAPSNDEVQNESGAVYSYFHDGNTWTFSERILHTDTPTTFTDNFGNAIDLEGSKSIIGSYKDDRDQASSYDSGAAYIFDHDIAPIAVNDTGNMIEDSGIIYISVLSNDTDVDGGSIFVESFTQAINGTVGQSGPRLSYKPNRNYCNDGNTTDDFTYTLNGGTQATVSITVTCVNDLPEAVEDYINITEDDTTTAIDVLANDTDVDGGDDILIASVTNPTNGTVNFSPTGVTYTPNADYCNLSTTLDFFTYTLTTGSTTDVAVRVSCINDQPSFQVAGDIDANQGLLTNGTEYSQMDFANNFVFGPSNENTQNVQNFNVNILSDSTTVITSIDVLNDGTLQIDFTQNQGVAIVEVSMQDDGGTSDGGVDTSDTLTFNVNFTDTMFSNGFEDSVATKSTQFHQQKSLQSSELIYDDESQLLIFKNYIYEINQEFIDSSLISRIQQWIQSVNSLYK